MVNSKRFISSMLCAIILLFGFSGLGSDVVNAEDKSTKIENTLPFNKQKATATDVEAETGTAVGGLVGTMYTFAKYLSGLIFGVSVIVIVWAGFKYATSQGDTKVTEQAKMQIITAGIGIGVALLAMIIVQVFKEIYLT